MPVEIVACYEETCYGLYLMNYSCKTHSGVRNTVMRNDEIREGVVRYCQSVARQNNEIHHIEKPFALLPR